METVMIFRGAAVFKRLRTTTLNRSEDDDSYYSVGFGCNRIDTELKKISRAIKENKKRD